MLEVAGSTICFLGEIWYCLHVASFEHQHATDRFSTAWNQVGMKIKKTDHIIPLHKSKSVYAAIKQQYTAAGRNVQVPWGGIRER